MSEEPARLQAPAEPPRSATSFALNLVGVATAIVVIFVLRTLHLSGGNAVLGVCLAGVVPIVVLEIFVLKVHQRPSTGLDWSRDAQPDWARIATKLLGLAVTLAPFLLAYACFNEYRPDDHGHTFYEVFYDNARRFALPLVAIAVLYVTVVDEKMKEPRDVYWQLGRLVLFHPEDLRRDQVANHYRTWLVKGFYIPLFIVYVHGQINGLLTWDLRSIQPNNVRLYDLLNDFVYALDVLYACVGYLLSLRIFDAHVRSAEPTMLGWLVALECYQPFWGALFSRQYLHYEGIGFAPWLQEHITLRWVWVAMILSMDSIYVLATFVFGLRFSNLTHRGILTNGPYRFTKHPAYVAKNISWWLITVPFVIQRDKAGDLLWASALRSCVCLAGVNFIYFMRAKTEERHLSRDPVYVAYALWMNEHGLFRFMKNVPLIGYRAPKPATPAPVSEPVAPAVVTVT